MYDKMSFLFFPTKYVKIRLQLQFYANVILLMIFIVDHTFELEPKENTDIEKCQN